MAGFGALLGAGRLLEAALWTAGVGGLLALGVSGVPWHCAKRAGGASARGSVQRFDSLCSGDRAGSLAFAGAQGLRLQIW